MPKIFVAFSFRDEDRALANQIDRLISSHNIRGINGERLGGGVVTDAVKNLIRESDGLVALLTRRDKVAGRKNVWRTHDWVQYELDYARDTVKIPAITLVEQGVELGGPYTANERIDFDRANPLEAFLRLSETIGLWRLNIGRTLKVRILPPDLAQMAGEGDTVKCRYRYYISGNPTDWKDGTPVPEPGGTFVYLKGVSDEHTIQLEVEENKRVKWLSIASPQWVAIELSKKGARK